MASTWPVAINEGSIPRCAPIPFDIDWCVVTGAGGGAPSPAPTADAAAAVAEQGDEAAAARSGIPTDHVHRDDVRRRDRIQDAGAAEGKEGVVPRARCPIAEVVVRIGIEVV
jgi:hypothetical protein